MEIKPFKFAKADIHAISQFEHRLPVALPAYYKTFLEHYNGGLPVEDIFYCRKDIYNVKMFLGLYPDNAFYYADIGWHMQNIVMPELTIPIASDGGGNLYLLHLTTGAIYFLSHEKSDRYNSNLNNLKKVAAGFKELVDSLQVSSLFNGQVRIIETDDEFIIE